MCMGRTVNFSTGEWSDWGPWGECSKTCDTGLRQRMRTCSVNHICVGMGLDSNTEYCHLEKCTKGLHLKRKNHAKRNIRAQLTHRQRNTDETLRGDPGCHG